MISSTNTTQNTKTANITTKHCTHVHLYICTSVNMLLINGSDVALSFYTTDTNLYPDM